MREEQQVPKSKQDLSVESRSHRSSQVKNSYPRHKAKTDWCSGDKVNCTMLATCYYTRQRSDYTLLPSFAPWIQSLNPVLIPHPKHQWKFSRPVSVAPFLTHSRTYSGKRCPKCKPCQLPPPLPVLWPLPLSDFSCGCNQLSDEKNASRREGVGWGSQGEGAVSHVEREVTKSCSQLW